MVCMTSPVSEVLLLFGCLQNSFRRRTTVHGGHKMEVAKFMQVEVEVKCMQTNFGGCGLFGFGDFIPFWLPSKTAKFPF